MPPVLACFSDQDARVRYYACESMYNIAKVAKGEILVYFNDVFDALCKLSADTELSVKNGAELLDRLVKDIVSESAATYASIMTPSPGAVVDDGDGEDGVEVTGVEPPTAFSLARFIPLLQERIHVLNAFTRNFLVSWITLLDSIPDLELVAHLPSFLGGLLRFLTDPNTDVHTITKVALDRFLGEIKKIAAVKKGIAEGRKSREELNVIKASGSSVAAVGDSAPVGQRVTDGQEPTKAEGDDEQGHIGQAQDTQAPDDASSYTAAEDDDADIDDLEDEWIPGQDVRIDYPKILDILVTFLSESTQEEIQVTTLKWIESFLDICPEEIFVFTPRLLAQVLPALSHDVDMVKQAANRVNQALMTYVLSLPEDAPNTNGVSGRTQIPTAAGSQPASAPQATASGLRNVRETNNDSRRDSTPASTRAPRKQPSPDPADSTQQKQLLGSQTPEPPDDEPATHDRETSASRSLDFDYESAVNSLTLQFLHEHEATRVAALAWLIMLHRKSPRKILAIHDGTFPALLKTLSDPAEAVVTRDLLLLSQISKNSDDSYFTSFMVNLLKLFCTDRRLLETRGNLIIRQLCLSLSAERIYRTMADILEKEEEDIEFASIMVQNLNNNLITAPELADLRKRLRNLDTKEGQTFFTVLFRAWCVNAVATFSLCLLAQAYEQAYNLLQIFADLEMSVTMLIQIDKLVQLLESPVFTYLRMQLLEPERFPHLYKCMYGVLMLLPQSSAFAALRNRLNSVAPIGYLQMASGGLRSHSSQPTTPSSVSTFERQNRLKAREDGGIRWTELLDKFRATQDRVRRLQQRALNAANGIEHEHAHSPPGAADGRAADSRSSARPGSAASLSRHGQAHLTAAGAAPSGPAVGSSAIAAPSGAATGKSRTGGLAGRFSGVAARAKAKR